MLHVQKQQPTTRYYHDKLPEHFKVNTRSHRTAPCPCSSGSSPPCRSSRLAAVVSLVQDREGSTLNYLPFASLLVCVTVFILSVLLSSSCLRHSPHFVCVTVLILSASQSSFCLCHSPHFVCVRVLILSVSESSFCLCHSPHFVCVSLHLVCATVFILSVPLS